MPDIRRIDVTQGPGPRMSRASCAATMFIWAA